MKKYNIEFTENERAEVLSRLIETFEAFLEERGIDIPNEEKDEDIYASTIYGTDYGELEVNLFDTLQRWMKGSE